MRTIMRCVVLLGLSLGLGVGSLMAQMEPCGPPGGNELIRRMLQGGRWSSIDEVHLSSPPVQDDRGHWATSYLRPSGTRPSDPDAEIGWTCQYLPERVRDDDSTSAWCEGVEGDGVGEVLFFPAGYYQDRLGGTYASSRLTGLRIWVGFGKSPALFRANGRPRELQVTIARKRPFAGGDSVEVQIADQRTVELQDLDGWQDVPLPEVRFDESFSFLALEIRSVYAGTRYHDTCISGIIPVTSPIPVRPSR